MKLESLHIWRFFLARALHNSCLPLVSHLRGGEGKAASPGWGRFWYTHHDRASWSWEGNRLDIWHGSKWPSGGCSAKVSPDEVIAIGGIGDSRKTRKYNISSQATLQYPDEPPTSVSTADFLFWRLFHCEFTFCVTICSLALFSELGTCGLFKFFQ